MIFKVKFLRFVIFYTLLSIADSLHIRGTWNSRDFFLFLSKFGFQRTDLHEDKKVNTQGYIYGNITVKYNDSVPADLNLVVVDSEYFLDYFSNSTVIPHGRACSAMFKTIDTIAWDVYCKPNNPEDFLRRIPCPKGQLCIDEDSPNRVVKGFQFTYSVQDANQPRFWYVSIVSCYRDTSCNWTTNQHSDVTMDYDIWLVNGNPYTKHFNPFEHQFSFEEHDIVEIYAAFTAVFTILLPIQIHAFRKLRHAMTKLLTGCILMEYIGLVLNLVHYLIFAFDGVGFDIGKLFGNFIDSCAECLLIMMLLLTAKGWMVTKSEFEKKVPFFIMWGIFAVLNVVFFIWNVVDTDVISNTGQWETWPGLCILVIRFLVVIWFLHELRQSISSEMNKDKINFYLHFGAGFLVWFIYLPIIAVIGMKISALWRLRIVLSVTFAADFLASLVLVHIFWPSPSKSFIFSVNGDLPKTTVELNQLGPAQFKRLLDEESSESADSEIEDETSITKTKT